MSDITSIRQVPGENLVQKLERFGEGRVPRWRELAFMLRCVERAALLLKPLPLENTEWEDRFHELLETAVKAVRAESLPGDAEELGDQAEELYNLIPRDELGKTEVSMMNACVNSVESLFWFMAGAIDFHCVADSVLQAAEYAGSCDTLTDSLAEDFDQLAFQGKSYADLEAISG